MELQSKVIYNSEVYTLKWIYNNGYCEIQKDQHLFELVKLSEITPLESNIKLN